jgi:hypothetical protein
VNAGRSVASWAAETRRSRPWWRRLLAALGWWPDREADQRDAGAEGERRTAALLAPLLKEGWHILHDRAIPGSRANLDHVLVPPHGRYLIALDTKLWSRHKGTLDTRAGRLVHGCADRHKAIETVAWEADRAAALCRVPAYPVIVMHSAPVAGGEVTVDAVIVAGPERLMSRLRAHAATGSPDRAGAARLAARVERILPAYT